MGNMYSIKVDSRGRTVEVARGVLLDALHYCGNTCVFERKQGLIDPALFNRAFQDMHG